ncbi:MAG TPA: 4Fe-4S binding protein [bacterium]|nr:4Fe-4S binding protein [bacterium]
MSDEIFLRIARNIDQGPLTAPRGGAGFSEAFIKFLKLVYTPEQAQLVQHLKMGMKFTSAADLAAASGKSVEEVEAILAPLTKKGRVMGFGANYALPMIPLLLNNHQFRPELGADDIAAGRLYQEFFIKDGFYRYYESSRKGTQIMRVIPVRRAVKNGQTVLDTEEAHQIIDAVKNLRLVSCPCRTRTEKLGVRECRDKYPLGSCIMMETSALYFENLGIGKKVTAPEAKRYFDEMQELGLVGTTENYEDAGHTVICLCCDCCCSQLRGRTRWENPEAVAPSNFVAESNEDCVMCGTCVDRCFFKAISLDEGLGRAVVDADKCMGCGVCALACDQEALRLKRVEREKPYAGPRELYKKVALENRGKSE